MKVVWSREAQSRLREIVAFVSKDSPVAGQSIAEMLIRRSLALTVPPLTGRRLPEFPASELREVLERPYRLIYLASAAEVQIVTVMHYRQLLPDSLEKPARK